MGHNSPDGQTNVERIDKTEDMKYIFYSLLAVVLSALVMGCESRKTIPDKELASIFHDAMIVNAYIGNQNIDLDSLNIYEPIFAHYGYTTEDVRYTMSSFLRRKSANLSDVVNDMIEQIEHENDLLKLAVTKLDTIESAAQRFARQTLVQDTAVVIKKAADTVKLRYAVEVKNRGEYKISARYTIDSIDKSRGRRFTVKKLYRDSTTHQVHSSSMQMLRDSRLTATINISEKDSNVIALNLYFDDFSSASKAQRKDFPRPKISKMTLEEVKVVFTPELEQAIEQLYDKQLKIRIFADTMFFPPKEVATEEATDEEVTTDNATDEEVTAENTTDDKATTEKA